MTDDPRTEACQCCGRPVPSTSPSGKQENLTLPGLCSRCTELRCDAVPTNLLPTEAGDVEALSQHLQRVDSNKVLRPEFWDRVAGHVIAAGWTPPTCAHDFQTRPTIGPPYESCDTAGLEAWEFCWNAIADAEWHSRVTRPEVLDWLLAVRPGDA